MAGILNNTARQFNLKLITKDGQRAVVRVAPGFNVVPDEIWAHFIKPKVDPYVAELKKAGQISFGKEVDDMEWDKEPDTKAKAKVESVAKIKEKFEKSEAEKNEAVAKAEKAQTEAENAKLENEKLKLELAELKKKVESSK